MCPTKGMRPASPSGTSSSSPAPASARRGRATSASPWSPHWPTAKPPAPPGRYRAADAPPPGSCARARGRRFCIARTIAAAGRPAGKPDRQTLVPLTGIRAGTGRDVALGDLAVVENASIHGRIVRGDVPLANGHGGTVVFVPQAPYTTYTGDDGSFRLDNLPAAPV